MSELLSSNRKINTAVGNLVVLSGGVGGGRLVYGLSQIVPPEKLTIIVNTGNDIEHIGLYISPDMDDMLYILGGLSNSLTGRGIKDESWNMMTTFARCGGESWFQLGDKEMAVHLLRSQWLRDGYLHHQIIKELSRRLGIQPTVLPMSEEPVRTVIQTAEGEMSVQEYLWREQGLLTVTGVRFEGAENAKPSREVVRAIRNADLIILPPSDPIISLRPILSIPSLHRLLAATSASKIGVSPIIGGEASKGVYPKIMAGLGLEISPIGVAKYFAEILTGFVINHIDELAQESLTDMNLSTLVTSTSMNSQAEQVRLAGEILEFAGFIKEQAR